MLRELFTQVELGDQTPSQLMRHMRSLLAGRHMDDATFREIWLEKSPVKLQQVLAMLDSNTSLEKLSTRADRIKDCYLIGASCSNIQQPPPSKGKPHRGIYIDSEGPALSEHDTPYTEKSTMLLHSLTSAHVSRSSQKTHRRLSRRLRRAKRHCAPPLHSVKRPRQPVMATTAAGPSRTNRLFYINGKSSGLRFLVDTGAEVSVIPPLRRHRLKPSQFSFQAANSTTISTYGQRSLTLGLGLRRRFQWVFIEADVKSSIIGAEFLSSFGLRVDVRHRRLTTHHPTLYHRRFIPHCAAILALLTELLKSNVKPIELSPAARTAFEKAKKALADATMLHHVSSDAHAQLILTTDASSSAVGAVLHQQMNNQLQPLAFFSQKLQPAQTRSSTFSRELLAIYLAIRHFRHLLEGGDFSVHTDHTPLTYALKAKPDRYSPREVRHLDYISSLLQISATSEAATMSFLMH
nr:unnamed protein product [Spirometra erinaceieuropaei]